VLDDFGSGLGRAWRDRRRAYRPRNPHYGLLDGQCNNPVRVIGFNTAEGWSRDVSEEVAHELRQRCADQRRDLPFSVQEFVERCMGRTEKSR
jgi:hypothetical protein